MPAAEAGLTTPSIAEASSGSSKRYGPSDQEMSTSSGSRVRREGTIAMSSNPNARRPFLPRPISTSTTGPPSLQVRQARRAPGRKNPAAAGSKDRKLRPQSGEFQGPSDDNSG